MTADILHFPPRFARNACYSEFRKALVAITIIADFSDDEAMQLITLWRQESLLSDDEAAALHAFYGWERRLPPF